MRFLGVFLFLECVGGCDLSKYTLSSLPPSPRTETCCEFTTRLFTVNCSNFSISDIDRFDEAYPGQWFHCDSQCFDGYTCIDNVCTKDAYSIITPILLATTMSTIIVVLLMR